MKIIAVTQRVDIHGEYQERRDSIDQRWYQFLLESQCLPLLIPNDIQQASHLINKIEVDGLLLTGGNTLTCLGGDSPERDETETMLLEYAIKRKLPVIGVCRGMQLLLNHWGTKLNKIAGHVCHKQTISINGHQKRRL